MRNDCKLWREGALKRSLQKFSVYANVSSGLLGKVYITEVDLNIEDGDTFFPEFDINDFEVLIGETLGEEVKYTRTFYVRKNELSRFWI